MVEAIITLVYWHYMKTFRLLEIQAKKDRDRNRDREEYFKSPLLQSRNATKFSSPVCKLDTGHIFHKN